MHGHPSPPPWPALKAQLDEALAQEPTHWIGITTMRPQDDIRRRAYEAMQAVGWQRGGMDWASPAARMAAEELAAFLRPLYGMRDEAPVIFTAGGTESIFLALHAARTEAERSRPGREPYQVLTATSGHPSIDKAARYLGLEVVRTPLDAELRADAGRMAEAIGERAIAIVASLPSDAHGMCDPIEELAALAARHGLWLHVDGALGGCLVPFLRRAGEAGLPRADFGVPGIRSASADLHKYGYAPIGISALLLREPDDRALAGFAFDGWDGYAYRSERFAGMRSFDTLAGAWATARLLGVDGYVERAGRIAANMRAFAACVGAVPGIEVLNRPEAGMVLFGASGAAREAFPRRFRERGHRGNITRTPPGFIVCIGPDAGPHDLELYESEVATVLSASD